MRGFVRFSLATLLLACVFAGAVMGCWIGRNPWLHQHDLPPAGVKSANCHLNDYLTFDEKNEKLAVFRSNRKILELYDLATRKSVWTATPSTCGAGVSLSFHDTQDRLFVGSPHDAPFRMDCLFVSDGKHDGNAKNFREQEWPSRNTVERVRLDERKLQTADAWNQYSDKPIVYETAKCTYRLKDGLPGGKEWAVPSPDIDQPPQPLCKIFSAGGLAIEIRTEKPVVAARYSGDGRLLALMDDQGVVSVWKRSRFYDPRGMFLMPVFWIAVGAGIGLLFKIVRLVFGGRRRESQIGLKRVEAVVK